MSHLSSSTAEELSELRDTFLNLPMKKLMIALIMVVASILIVRVLNMLAGRALKRTRLDVSQHRFVKALLRVILYFFAIMVIASYLGIDVTSMVALISVISLAVSLSVQNVLSNVAGGMMVIGTKPFKQGDYVSVDQLEGTIDEIGVIYTKLHTIDNRCVLIPNSTVCASTIVNFSALGKRRLELEVSVAYDTDPALVMAALRKAIDRCEHLEDEEVAVEFQDFGASGACYHVHFWIPGARFLQIRYNLRRFIWEEFRARGIPMAYPHMDVHIQGEKAQEKP